MINPTPADIGRSVVYQASHPGAKREDGVITSFNDYCIFVHYQGDMNSKGTDRHDLTWLRGGNTP